MFSMLKYSSMGEAAWNDSLKSEKLHSTAYSKEKKLYEEENEEEEEERKEEIEIEEEIEEEDSNSEEQERIPSPPKRKTLPRTRSLSRSAKKKSPPPSPSKPLPKPPPIKSLLKSPPKPPPKLSSKLPKLKKPIRAISVDLSDSDSDHSPVKNKKPPTGDKELHLYSHSVNAKPITQYFFKTIEETSSASSRNISTSKIISPKLNTNEQTTKYFPLVKQTKEDNKVSPKQIFQKEQNKTINQTIKEKIKEKEKDQQEINKKEVGRKKVFVAKKNIKKDIAISISSDEQEEEEEEEKEENTIMEEISNLSNSSFDEDEEETTITANRRVSMKKVTMSAIKTRKEAALQKEPPNKSTESKSRFLPLNISTSSRKRIRYLNYDDDNDNDNDNSSDDESYIEQTRKSPKIDDLLGDQFKSKQIDSDPKRFSKLAKPPMPNKQQSNNNNNEDSDEDIIIPLQPITPGQQSIFKFLRFGSAENNSTKTSPNLINNNNSNSNINITNNINNNIINNNKVINNNTVNDNNKINNNNNINNIKDEKLWANINKDPSDLFKKLNTTKEEKSDLSSFLKLRLHEKSKRKSKQTIHRTKLTHSKSKNYFKITNVKNASSDLSDNGSDHAESEDTDRDHDINLKPEEEIALKRERKLKRRIEKLMADLDRYDANKPRIGDKYQCSHISDYLPPSSDQRNRQSKLYLYNPAGINILSPFNAAHSSEIETITDTLTSPPLFANKFSIEKLYRLYFTTRDPFDTMNTALRNPSRYCNVNDCWTDREKAAFEDGFRKHYKLWRRVQLMIPTKTVEEIYTYYYYWKINHPKTYEKICAQLAKQNQKKNFLVNLRRKGKKVPKLNKIQIPIELYWENINVMNIDNDITNLCFEYKKDI